VVVPRERLERAGSDGKRKKKRETMQTSRIGSVAGDVCCFFSSFLYFLLRVRTRGPPLLGGAGRGVLRWEGGRAGPACDEMHPR
jgi:hypothetical protein